MNYALETWGVTVVTLVATFSLCQSSENDHHNNNPVSKLTHPRIITQQTEGAATTTLSFHQPHPLPLTINTTLLGAVLTEHSQPPIVAHSVSSGQPLLVPDESHVSSKDPGDLGRALDDSSRPQGRDLLGFLFGRRDAPPPPPPIHQYRPPMGPPRNQYFHHPERGPGPMVNPIFNSNKDMNMPNHKLEGGFVPINKKSTQQHSSVDHLEQPAASRPSRKVPCDFYTDSICLETNPYPYDQLRRMASEEISLLQRLIVDVRDQNAGLLVDGVSSREEVHYDYEHYYGIQSNNTHSYRDYGADGGYICPSDIKYSRPKRAKNAQGKWKIIINFGEFSQTVRMERCLKPYAKCSYVFNYINSECLQVYNYQRFVSWDQEMGFHIDIFKVPTACSCHLRSSTSARKLPTSATELPTFANTIDRYGNIESTNGGQKEISAFSNKEPLENSAAIHFSQEFNAPDLNHKAGSRPTMGISPPVPVPIRLGRPGYGQRIMFGSSGSNPHSGFRNRITAMGPQVINEPTPYMQQHDTDTDDEDQPGFSKVNYNFNPMTAYMLPRNA